MLMDMDMICMEIEIDDRVMYYSDVPGVDTDDTMYVDGAKKPTELGFFYSMINLS